MGLAVVRREPCKKACKTTKKITDKNDLSLLVKRFEKVVFKKVGMNPLSDVAEDIVSSFKLEPFDEVSAEDPVEFTTPGFNGEFGDGTGAKGDGVV